MEKAPCMLTWNTNRIELDAWLDKRKRRDGDYDLIGMGRRTEYDAKTGAVVSDKVEPTGVTVWAPREFIEPRRAPWWRRLFGAA